MNKTKLHEILPGLPPYGPTPIAIGNQTPYSEGFVIKFFKKNGDEWVGNFGKGVYPQSNFVFDYPDQKVWVFVGGEGYLIDVEKEKPLKTLVGIYKQILKLEDGRLIAYDPCSITVIENSGESWTSERISWDDIKDITVEGDILRGLSFDPMNNNEKWVPFSINLTTKKIEGGSYRIYDLEKVREGHTRIVRKK